MNMRAAYLDKAESNVDGSDVAGSMGKQKALGVGSIADGPLDPMAHRNSVLYKLAHLFGQLPIRAIAVGAISVTIGLFLWHWATLYKFNYFVNFEHVPAPLLVGDAFSRHFFDPAFHTHVLVSLRRIFFAYSIAVVLGIVIGLIVGRSRTARSAILPYIEIIRPIPAVAWIPLAILMWPTEEASIIYITLLGALFPIILNTVHGVEQTPEVLVRAAQSLGANRAQVFWHVVLPAAMPSIAAGLAIGMGISWFSLLAGEIISGQFGIGYFTWHAYSMINYTDIVVGMLVIGALGSLSTYLVRLITRPMLRWNRKLR
ncbi:ABC transporter permease [Marinimicrobium sp. ABcell2]|uniref:ABC transporter permease n=1 Tax=Marinimicrobium sp. ABcell2 TaxID=3069751 RepID=UPI0027B6C8DB|nr:ABC transporter permease [Marinimicrobium sp. ABcell2]MDQ2078047.1 ABC transporter permease [Marinimicrobium sp. ABcell2]